MFVNVIQVSMSEKIIDISELKPDDKNFNKHTEFGMSLLEKSVSKFGMGRSILIDKDNKIIAGNGVAETAGSVGIDRVRVIETDGNEIIAVKRTDVSLDSEQGREMALADNATSAANLQWNVKEIEKEMGAKAAEWGLSVWHNSENIDIDSLFEEKSEDKKKNEVKIEIFIPGEKIDLRDELCKKLKNIVKDYGGRVV